MKFAAATVASAVALAAAGLANADYFQFSYTGFTVQATGILEIYNGVAVSGSVTVTGNQDMAGEYSLLSMDGISPLGMFDVDSVVMLESNPLLTGAGLLFTGANGEVNIWGNGAENYSMWRGNQNGYSADDGGNFAMVIPGPGAAALLALAGVVGARKRRA